MVMIQKIVLILALTITLYAKSTVSDRETGLMWQDSSKIVKKDWKGAKSYCKNLSLGGYNDWFLPNIDELMSISDKKRYKPAIKKIFKNTKNNWYWSSTNYKNDSSQAWYVGFYNALDFYDSKSNKRYVRCVRERQ